jgi:hypothetical protein
MTGIVAQMTDLIVPKNLTVKGTVQSIDGQSIVVVSSQGVRRFWVPTPSAFTINDNVLFQGDVLIGRVTSETQVPYFTV